MLRSILVPLDGSELAERALSYATALSIPTAARMILVRAVRAHTIPGADERPAQAAAVAQAQAYLEEVSARLAQRGFACETATPYGDAAPWILEEAQLRGADLIVMTSHGRTGPGRWLLGSVAESVVAHSPVPVVVDRAWRPIDREPLLIDRPRLLVPLDGSPFAEAALDVAVGLAEDLGGDLQLLRVEPLPEDSVMDEVGRVVVYMDQLMATARSNAYDYLSGIASGILERSPSTQVRTEVVFGEPSNTIAKSALDTRCGLIVMSTHGRTGMHRAVMGSVAGLVLEGATTPLVLVHPVTSPSPSTTAAQLSIAPV